MRQALGIAVFFGMIGVTVFGLLFTPSFYIISRNLGDRVRAWSRPRTATQGDALVSEVPE
jgi:HAE1 family hydrophobic/amphiphilic exporter-1